MRNERSNEQVSLKDNFTHTAIKLTLHYLEGIFLSIKELNMAFPDS